MAPTNCLIHWIEEGRWDVWPKSKVPPEICFEGGLGLITYIDGKKYLGKIIKVSADTKEIDAAEVALHASINSSNAQPSDKRKPKKKKFSGKASDNDVSRALGERSQLSTPQRAARQKQLEANRAKTAAQTVTEAKEDAKLVKTARQLFPPDVNGGILSDEDQVSDEDEAASNSSSDEDNDFDQEISDFKNPNTVCFLQFLLKRFGSKDTLSVSSKNVYAQPVCQGNKMVRLKKGYSLKVDKGARNVLVLDKKSQKSATNFVRQTLNEIYGEEQLQQMTAKGRKKGTLTICPEHLSAIYGFVTEHSKDLSWGEFIRTITKKCAQAKKQDSFKNSKDKTPTSTAKTANKSVAEQKSATKQKSPAEERSPAKTDRVQQAGAQKLSVAASPAKFQKSIHVTHHTPPVKEAYQYDHQLPQANHPYSDGRMMPFPTPRAPSHQQYQYGGYNPVYHQPPDTRYSYHPEHNTYGQYYSESPAGPCAPGHNYRNHAGSSVSAAQNFTSQSNLPASMPVDSAPPPLVLGS